MKEKFVTILALCFFFIMPILGGLITSEPTETTEMETTTTETETHPKEQEYLVRYATPIHTNDNGITTYEDTDGNLWCVQDAPETNGDVKIIFNSMETFTITDDVIVDITEIK